MTTIVNTPSAAGDGGSGGMGAIVAVLLAVVLALGVVVATGNCNSPTVPVNVPVNVGSPTPR